MTMSRRTFLQAGLAGGAGENLAFAETRPLLGLIAPPADYPIPPEGLALYDSLWFLENLFYFGLVLAAALLVYARRLWRWPVGAPDVNTLRAVMR